MTPRFSRRWNSLRLRFLVAVLAWVALGIGGIWFAATHLFAKHVEQQYHEELEVHIAELAALTRFTPDGRIEMIRPLSDPRYLVPLSGFYWQISVDRGERLHSPSMTCGAFDPEIAHARQVDRRFEPGPTGPAIAYGMTRPAPGGKTAHFVIATDRRLLANAIAGFSRELSQWLTLLGLGLAGTGLAVVVFGLRPLDRLAASVARLREGRIVALDGDYPAEVSPLVEDLNAFLASNRATLDRARVQAGNLAHALRTPLAVITDEAERLVARGQARDSAETMLDQAQHMARQIEYHLAHARSTAGIRLPGTASILPDTLEPLVKAMRKLHPEVTWRLTHAPGFRATVPVDPVDLSELLSNLLDNAGKWARHQVDVALASAEGSITVTIADDGPGMRDEDIARAGEIGLRFDESRPGSGLGLAIVRDIARAWNLQFTIGHADAGGLAVTLGFEPA